MCERKEVNGMEKNRLFERERGRKNNRIAQEGKKRKGK